MLNHYEKNKKAVSLSQRIRKDADTQGVSPLLHVMADSSYHSMLELAGLAASYAEVSAAYDEAGKDNYSAVVRQPRTRNFVGLMSQMSGVIPSEYQKDSMAASISSMSATALPQNKASSSWLITQTTATGSSRAYGCL